MIPLTDLLDTVLRKLDGGECPSPSRVALELMALLERPNASVAEAATLVRLDSVLTAKILELANSVLYRGSRPVLALPDAILRLGLRTLAHFVLGLSLTKTRSPIPGLDLSRYWARALVRALFLEELVTRVGSWSKAEVFTLGLLSDVGYLLLFCAVPESMAELLGSAVDPHEMPVAEQERLGINHIELTALLLERWGFPQLMLRAVRSQLEAVPVEEDSRLGRLCHLLEAGRLFADLWDDTLSNLQQGRLRWLRQQLEVDDVAFQQIAERVQGEWRQLSGLFELQPPKDAEQRWTGFMEYVLNDAGRQAAYRVLVIDDDESSRTLLRRYLEPVGYEVHEAAGSAEALRVIDQHAPRIILIDWCLGQDDGLELCQRLRSRYGARMFLVMLSAFAEDTHGTHALEYGANEFLTKPISRRVLLAKLRTAVESVALMLDLEQERQAQIHAHEQLLRMNEELRDDVMRDALTGLYNRRAWETFAPKIWQRAESAGIPVACIMLDIDYFKRVNDQFGHDIGDLALAALADLLQRSTRETDLVVRLGGEEFVILTASADLAGVRQMTQRIAADVAQLHGAFPSFTVSGGGAFSQVPAVRTLSDLLRLADQNLLQAKRGGRNNIVWPDGMPAQ